MKVIYIIYSALYIFNEKYLQFLQRNRIVTSRLRASKNLLKLAKILARNAGEDVNVNKLGLFENLKACCIAR